MNIPSSVIRIAHVRPMRIANPYNEKWSNQPKTIAYTTRLLALNDNVNLVLLEMGFAFLSPDEVFVKKEGVRIATNNLQDQHPPRYAAVTLGFADTLYLTDDYSVTHGHIPVIKIDDTQYVTVSKYFDITTFVRNYADAFCINQRSVAKQSRRGGQSHPGAVAWTMV